MDPMSDPSPAGSARPRAVLADDERLMREQLRARLAEVWPELDVVAEARNGLEAVQLVDQHRPETIGLALVDGDDPVLMMREAVATFDALR